MKMWVQKCGAKAPGYLVKDEAFESETIGNFLNR